MWGATGAVAAFGPISIFELSGRESLAAVLLGVYSLSVATGARLSGRFMDRAGRRPGLALGYVALGAGGAGAAVAVASGSTSALIVAAAVIGAGAGTALLGRAAVADMYPPERRGRAVGLVLLAGTIGAVGGPPLAGVIHAAARIAGFDRPLLVPWLLVPVLATVGLALVLSLRPDPRDLAVGSRAAAARRPLEVLRARTAMGAVATIAAVQVVMVTFMSVVPVVLHAHHAGELTVSIVVSLHLAGMFALSSVIGSALDRWGRRTGLLGGLGLSAVGVLLSLGEGTTILPAAGLLLIGIGWSMAYVGSTAIVSDVAAPAERAGALGLTDLVASVSAAVGVLSGAALLQATSLVVLSVAALILLSGGLGAVVLTRERAVVPAG
ncbi:MAG TPA: MFS transporter [Actinomycetota bacterium]|nr:MFS transporter [Actinomycetota bacterium]